MSEQQAPVLEKTEVRTTPPPEPPKKQKKKKKMPKAVKAVVTIVILAAIAAVVAAVLYFLVFKEDETQGAPMTQPVMRSSIQSMVEGSGMTRARDSATITPNPGGKVLELYVQEGDQVEEGQPLYVMDDTAAQQAISEAQDGIAAAQDGVDDARKAVADAQKAVDDRREELAKIYEKMADLSVTAPHPGNLREVGTFKAGDDAAAGTTVATLVNDTKLRLSLYYSYAYENDIYVGQTARITIPATMGERTGTVEAVNKVRYVTPEGSIHFEVVFVLDNPGTLTEGMDASAILDTGGGPVYPYESGRLKYYETTEIKTKVSGPVERVNLLNYADVTEGALLLQLGPDDINEEIEDKEKEIRSAEEAVASAQERLEDAQERLDEALKKLEDAQEELDKYNAVAPISGTVLNCSLTAGEEVASGQGITIADTSVMTIEIQVDERSVRYVQPGMIVDIDQYGTYYMGIVESVSQTATAENGMASFPAVVKVDNPDGLLMSNMYVSYSFVASESGDCLVVPIQAVKYVTLSGGDDMMGGDMLDGWDDSWSGEDGLDPGVMVDGAEDFDAEPQSYAGGASAKPLAVAVSGGGVIVSSSGFGGGGSGGSSGSNSGEATVCFVKTDTPPANAVEADPAWGCPEGFVPVLVELGLADNMNVEIKSGLNEGDEVFIGYETLNANSWGW